LYKANLFIKAGKDENYRLMKRMRISVLVFTFLSIVVFLFLFFLSTFVKNWITNNSEEITGRKIAIGALHFNYAKVSLQANEVTLFEANDADSFFSFREFYIDVDLWRVLSGEYSFSEVRLDKPRIQIIRDGDQFNFADLIPEEDSIPAQNDSEVGKLIKYTLKNLRLSEGTIVYRDMQQTAPLVLDSLTLNIPLISWNNQQSEGGLQFKLGEQGEVEMKAIADNEKNAYTLDLKTSGIDLNPFSGYLKGYLDIGELQGYLSSQIKINGKLDEITHVTLSGDVTVNDFSLKDSRKQPVISWESTHAGIKSLDPEKMHFEFSVLEFRQPRIDFVADKDMTNLERFILPYLQNQNPGQDSIDSKDSEVAVTYQMDSLKIVNGVVSLTDNTLNRPFRYALNDLTLNMFGLTESADRIPVDFKVQLNQRGSLQGTAAWSLRDPMKIEVAAEVKKLDLISFSPYSEYYVAFPMTQGWLNYLLTLQMSQTSLKNENKIKIDELEFGKRTKDETAIKAPVKLGLYLMKDRNDQIHIDFPVSGNPSDPQFKIGKLIWQAFLNLMVKAATSPFNALADLAGTNPESLEKLPFSFLQDSLDVSQKTKLTSLSKILARKPDLKLLMIQHTDQEAEKRQLALLMAKEEYLHQPGSGDSLRLQKASLIENTDPGFLAYLRQKVILADSIGVEAASAHIFLPEKIDARFQDLLTTRNRTLHDFIILQQGLPEESVQISTADLNNLPQELRKPQYKVEVTID
jgi:hypothetical protein